MKTEQQWREQLTPEQFQVCREKATERAFSGKYYADKTPGTYHCVCCGAELFNASDKFDSGSGWPSFTRPAVAENVAQHQDLSHGMQREEVVCKTCGAHLGHVFDDGPAPGGRRYCINSVALKLEPESR